MSNFINVKCQICKNVKRQNCKMSNVKLKWEYSATNTYEKQSNIYDICM